MTEHEELELLKKQYAAVKAQRDDLKLALINICGKLHSAADNNFDLKDTGIVDRDGNRVSAARSNLDVYISALKCAGYYHIGTLLGELKECGLADEKLFGEEELKVLLKEWKLPEEIAAWRSWNRQGDKTADDPKGLKTLATMLIVFSREFQFGTQYPADDIGIYTSVFFDIVNRAMRLAGITNDGIEDAIKEVYGRRAETPEEK